MALGDIHFHLVTSTFDLRGRHGTWCHLPSFHVTGVALGALRWIWWRAWARLVAGTLRGRRGTWRHPHHLSHTIFPTHTHNFVTHHLSHTIFVAHHLYTPYLAHHLSHTILVTHHLSHHFVTHHLSHTILHTPLCRTPSFTHHLSHTTLSHTIFNTHL